MRKPYVIYKRARKKGFNYYVKFWNPELNKYDVWYAIGNLKDQLGTKASRLSHTSKAGADAIVRLWIEEGRPTAVGDTFAYYIENFWEPDSEYVKAKVLRGKKISPAYLGNNKSGIKNHVIPYLEAVDKKRLTVSQVTPGLLENMLTYLSDNTELSTRRINAIFQAVTVPLSEAKRLGKISVNPAESVHKLAEKQKIREILTPEEVRAFFAGGRENEREYAINMLAATTGMRLGECRGLLIADLHEGWIDINSNWQDGEGLKAPKWGSSRAVPLPVKTYEVLKDLADSNPWGNQFVFYGTREDIPIGKKTVDNYYSKRIEAIGIENRRDRGLTFHSWRHFYNTMLRGHVPDHALRQLTGHHSEEMTDRYSTITDDQRTAVKGLAEGLF